MRIPPHRLLVLALEGRKTIRGRRLPTKEEAREGLRRLTGQDFGQDAEAWKAWIKDNRKALYGETEEANRFTQRLDEKNKSDDEDVK